MKSAVMIFVLLLMGTVVADSTVVDIYTVTFIQNGDQVDKGNATSTKELARKLDHLEFLNIDADSIWIFYYRRVYWPAQDSMVMYLLDIQNMNPVADTLGEQWFDRDSWDTYLSDTQTRYYPME